MATGNAKQQEQINIPKPAKVVPVDTSIELPRPTHSLDQVKADLDRAGFAILEGVLTDAQAREVRDIVDSEIRREEAKDENTVRRFYTDPDAKNRRLSRLPNRHKWLRYLLEHPVAIKDSSVTLRQLLGYSSVSIGFDEQWENASDEIRALTVPATMQW